MPEGPEPLIRALRGSHDRLRALVGPLTEAGLRRQSYDTDWSIAQVLSHLGSGAEIFGMFLDAGLSGAEPPGREAFAPVWEVWNARSPQDVATEVLRADGDLTARFEALGPAERDTLRLSLFGMDADTTLLARMRLTEHALHSWDIAVALDPAATVAAEPTGLLIDTLGPMVARSAKPDGTARRLLVSTSGPERHFTLATGDEVTLTAAEDPTGEPGLRLPAEALLRLVSGRLDPAYTPAEVAGEAVLADLRPLFPGF